MTHDATEHFASPVANVIVVGRRPFVAPASAGFNKKKPMIEVVGFKIRNYFFKSSDLLHQSNLGLLGSGDFFLNFCDRRIAAGSAVNFLNLLRQIKRSSFEGFKASECFVYQNFSPSYELSRF